MGETNMPFGVLPGMAVMVAALSGVAALTSLADRLDPRPFPINTPKAGEWNQLQWQIECAARKEWEDANSELAERKARIQQLPKTLITVHVTHPTFCLM